jgi:hypothetical protein
MRALASPLTSSGDTSTVLAVCPACLSPLGRLRLTRTAARVFASASCSTRLPKILKGLGGPVSRGPARAEPSPSRSVRFAVLNFGSCVLWPLRVLHEAVRPSALAGEHPLRPAQLGSFLLVSDLGSSVRQTPWGRLISTPLPACIKRSELLARTTNGSLAVRKGQKC